MNTDLVFLKQLGLDEKEAKVYLAALEFGPISLINLAKKAGVKRTTIYEFADDMVSRGLLITTASGKRRLFQGVHPDELGRLIERQKEVLSQMMPGLLLLADKNPGKPKIRFYEGKEGVKKVYYDTIEEKVDEMVYYSANAEVFRELSESFFMTWVKKRVKRGIYSRGIVPSDDVALRQHKNNVNKKELRETIIVSKKELPIENEMIIYGNRVALISLGEESIGVIIESKQIANLQRAIFNLLWKNLKKK